MQCFPFALQVTAEEISGNDQLLELQFSAKGLDKKVCYLHSPHAHDSVLIYHITWNNFNVQDFLGKSDPYLDFARQNPDGTYSAVHRIPVSLSVLFGDGIETL